MCRFIRKQILKMVHSWADSSHNIARKTNILRRYIFIPFLRVWAAPIVVIQKKMIVGSQMRMWTPLPFEAQAVKVPQHCCIHQIHKTDPTWFTKRFISAFFNPLLGYLNSTVKVAPCFWSRCTQIRGIWEGGHRYVLEHFLGFWSNNKFLFVYQKKVTPWQ